MPRAGTSGARHRGAGQGQGEMGSSQLCTYRFDPSGCALRPLHCAWTHRLPAPSLPPPGNRPAGLLWKPPGCYSRAQQAQTVPALLGRIKRLAPAGMGPRAGASCTIQPATLPGTTATLSWASVPGRALPDLPSTQPPSLRHLKMSGPCGPVPRLSPR